MKILVTGGAGYIGSHTCKELARQGHESLVYDHLGTGHREFVRWSDFVHGDILDTARLRAALRRYRPDGVIHFAALASVAESVADPGLYYQNNVAGTLSLLQAMRDEDVRHIVVSSSCAVYGQPERQPISEEAPTRPINAYGASKLFMERMLADFHAAHGLNWVALRYFNAAGADADGEIGEWHEPETHLIPNVVAAALGRLDEVSLFGSDYPTPDGSCIRDYIHVNDLARAHILALEHLARGGESRPFNLGTGNGISVFQILRGVEELCGPVPHRLRERRPGDPAELVADASQARQVLQWTPACSDLPTLLESALRWSRQSGR